MNYDMDGRLNDGRCDRQGRFICGGFNGGDENVSTRAKLQNVW
jgi:L-arabinonolactonase